MTDVRASGNSEYDGAHYHVEESYVCDCGFAALRGLMLENGSYPGGKVMVEHLETAHGWVRGKSDAAYRGKWRPPDPERWIHVV